MLTAANVERDRVGGSRRGAHLKVRVALPLLPRRLCLARLRWDLWVGACDRRSSPERRHSCRGENYSEEDIQAGWVAGGRAWTCRDDLLTCDLWLASVA